jgi:hypothetical protein
LKRKAGEEKRPRNKVIKIRKIERHKKKEVKEER